MSKSSPEVRRTADVPPDPAAMIESMRAFGYSLPGAIADLVDNSISAGASEISIDLRWNGRDSWIRVLDDGRGMDSQELTGAMRLGSRSPREDRAPDDLGRFGLGLKTAAFSQATVLTVASLGPAGETEVRGWDLGHVTDSQAWSLLLDPHPDDAPALDLLEEITTGTAVLLRNLDRLVDDADIEDEHAKLHFLRNAKAVENHLGAVFHRFLSSGLTIKVNGNVVDGWDPFLASDPATQDLPPESLPFGRERVGVQAYVLPHHSKLATEDHRLAAGTRGWNHHQGFYVYRAKRLLVAGDWLGLPMQKEEHYKLARIRVDLSNAMDLEWQIDVRKATARIPRELRDDLRRIAQATRAKAAEAYRYRGKRIARSANQHRRFVWSAEVKRGSVRYRVDRDHPLISETLVEAGEGRPALERAIRVIEETVPVQTIVMEAREKPDSDRAPFTDEELELAAMLRNAHSMMIEHGAAPRDALSRLASMEPFDSHPQIVAAFEEEIDS
jgi:hypothetical protein